MSSDSGSESPTEVSRHPEYYFDDPGCRVFLVENILYRLPMGDLCRQSRVLADMFNAGEEDVNGSEGDNDDDPIEIPQLSSSTFDLFVEHHFGSPGTGYEYTDEELSEFLLFCDKYQCDTTKEFVVNRIQETSWQFHPVELINLAVTYRISSLFRTAFRSLIDIPLGDLTKAHRVMMGMDILFRFVMVKSALDKFRRIVAIEEPVILMHADDCQDPIACRTDWRTDWWSGMGRYLLDGLNQPYDEAVRLFKTEVQFRRVGKGCKEAMFKFLDKGVLFQRADDIIDQACDDLLEKLRI